MTVNARLLLSLAGAMAFALPLASAAEDSVATAEPTVVAELSRRRWQQPTSPWWWRPTCDQPQWLRSGRYFVTEQPSRPVRKAVRIAPAAKKRAALAPIRVSSRADLLLGHRSSYALIGVGFGF
jgi:hypothetical protein